MNKIQGLKKLSEIGFEVYNYTIYHNDSNLNTLNKNKKYLLRRSSKNNIGEVFLGVEHNLSIDELLKKVIELNSSFDLIIQEEKIIDYYGSVSRISDGNYYILSIELFDTLENRISGIPCDRMENHYIDYDIIKREVISNNKFIKYVMFDLNKIDYCEYQLEFVVSNNCIYYTDFDIPERGKVYAKHFF